MTTGVYTITNTLNGQQYVGSSAISIEGRFKEHRNMLKRGCHRSQHLQRSWKRHGEWSFKFEILEETEPEFCLSMEQLWINLLHPIYNTSPVAGSQLGYKHSEETLRKMSISHTGKKHSSTTKSIMSLRLLGNKRWLGKEFTPEHRANIAAALMGHKTHPNTSLAVSESNRRRAGVPRKKRKTSAQMIDIRRRGRDTQPDRGKGRITMLSSGLANKAQEQVSRPARMYHP